MIPFIFVVVQTVQVESDRRNIGVIEKLVVQKSKTPLKFGFHPISTGATFKITTSSTKNRSNTTNS
jgi:hypothetical protein